jgi:hypothetical protein
VGEIDFNMYTPKKEEFCETAEIEVEMRRIRFRLYSPRDREQESLK